MKVNQVQPKPAQEKAICHFQYDPKKERLVIECQPIRPFTALDQVSVDRFDKQQVGKSSKANPGFKKRKPGDQIVLVQIPNKLSFKGLFDNSDPTEGGEKKSVGLSLLV